MTSLSATCHSVCLYWLHNLCIQTWTALNIASQLCMHTQHTFMYARCVHVKADITHAALHTTCVFPTTLYIKVYIMHDKLYCTKPKHTCSAYAV